MVTRSTDNRISVVILTLNEEVNLPKCLESLSWCDDIIVIDSFSTDTTEDICRRSGVRFLQHGFTGFGSQRNWVLDNIEIKHEWILFLDADESVPPELQREMRLVTERERADIDAYQVARRFYMWGKWLKYSSLYPTYVVRLIRKGRTRYIDRGHAETQTVQGAIGTLNADLLDQNRKGIEEWFERQNRYSSQEARYELLDETPLKIKYLFFGDALQRRENMKRLLRSLPFRPCLYFFYSYVLRLGFLDGRAGFQFCRMKTTYQSMIVAKKFSYEARKNMRA